MTRAHVHSQASTSSSITHAHAPNEQLRKHKTEPPPISTTVQQNTRNKISEIDAFFFLEMALMCRNDTYAFELYKRMMVSTYLFFFTSL